ncbi:MAG TPA: F0F1 ATP synthase subunit A [Dictyobacter sp.]|nr:F0F1 ATP synthase subunit A [Dictyobacter sp.]
MLWKLPNIEIAPDNLFHIGGFQVSNTLLDTWTAIIILVVLLALGTRRRDLIPSGWQNAIEWLVEAFQNLVESVAGKEKGKKFFPIVFTFFFFILIANLIDVIPGVDTIGTISNDTQGGAVTQQPVLGFLLFGADSNKIIPWLRPATTDLNMTLALAVVAMVLVQYFGFAMLGPKEHLSKYLRFGEIVRKGPMGLIDVFVGILEFIGELARLISFAFRLFGNIFAGSVLLAVFAYLIPVVINIAFIPFEIFVGAIQAFVFAFLSLLFMTIGTTSHQHSEDDVHEGIKEYEEARNEGKTPTNLSSANV